MKKYGILKDGELGMGLRISESQSLTLAPFSFLFLLRSPISVICILDSYHLIY